MSDSSQPPLSQAQSHAPTGKLSPLFLLSIISLFLGVILLVGRVVSQGDVPDLETESEQRRNLFLLVVGGYMTIQGLLLLLIHTARNPNLTAGMEGPLVERLEQAGLGQRLLLLPAVLVSHRRGRVVLNIGLMVLLATSLLLLVNYVFNRHDLWRIDLTRSSIYTLSEESAAVARGLEKEIRIVALMPRAADGAQHLKQVESLIQQYTAASEKISSEQFDPRVLKREQLQERLVKLEITGIADLDRGGIVVQAGRQTPEGWKKTKSKWIPQQRLWRQDLSKGYRKASRIFAGEQKITSAILEVLEEKRPKIYFLTGHEEPSIGDFKQRGLAHLVQRLRERNYDIATLNLLEVKRPGVPADADLLVVAGPKSDLTEEEVAAIKTYLMRGGDAMFMLEPIWTPRADKSAAWRPSALGAMLSETFGVGVMNRVIGRITARGKGNVSFWTRELVLTEFERRHDLTKPLADGKRRVWFATARPVQRMATLNVQSKEILHTSRLWGRGCRAMGQPEKTLASEQDQLPGPFAVGVAVNYLEVKPGKLGEVDRKRTRFLLFGDVDWISNYGIVRRAYANQELFLNGLNWCLEREARAVGATRKPPSYRLEMSDQQLGRFKAAAIFGLPALAVILGLFAWVVRFRS